VVGGAWAAFALVYALQTIAVGSLLGWQSPELALRLWATALIWIGTAEAAMFVTPLIAPGRTAAIWWVRAVGALMIVPSLAALFWLMRNGAVDSVIALLGVFMSLSAVVGTFVIERFVRVQPAPGTAGE
jgi:hypothetical protein